MSKLSRVKKDDKDVLIYNTDNVCAKVIRVILNENKIEEVLFVGGCNGNANAINRLIKDKDIQEVIDKLDGVNCGNKNTSCTDQLAQCLKEFIKMEECNENN